MKKWVQIVVGILVSVLVLSPIVQAASPHYKPRLDVTCSPSSASATGTTFAGSCSSGVAAGLGNEDLTFGVIATATAGTFCHNRGNPANIVPGQNPAETQFANLQTVPGSAIKNGNFTFPVVPFNFSLGTPTPEQAGCPNDQNWTVTVGSVTWSAQYVVYQPFPTLIESLSFAF
jgi:hypothetical protein